MDLIEAKEVERLAVCAGHILCRQDAQRAMAVGANNFLGAHLDVIGDDAVRLDKLLGERQIVAGLVFVIRKQIGIVAGCRRPREESIERGEYQVGGLPVFLGPAGEYLVVGWPAVIVEV